MPLTKEQQRVVDSQAQHTMALAGPGTGKTEMLANNALEQARSATGQENQGVSSSPCILVLSHTTHARDQIQKRIENLEPDENIRNRIRCITFHGYALKIITQYSAKYRFRPDCEVKIIRKILKNSLSPKKPSNRLVDDVASLFEEHVQFKKPIRHLDSETLPCSAEKKRSRSGMHSPTATKETAEEAHHPERPAIDIREACEEWGYRQGL